MYSGRDNSSYSWSLVIIALIVFWPVGLFLLFKKFSDDKKATLGASGKVMKIVGISLIIFVAIGLIGFGSSLAENGYRSDDTYGIVGVVFFAAGGVALLYKGNKVTKEAEQIRRYISVIVNGNVRKLSAIASATGKPYDVVYRDINNLINKGYLHNAYIDESSKKIVMPEDKYVKEETPRIVNCACCGANNTVYGDLGQCEYCGSPLK
ncbi:MAG: hypothetical protein IJA62_01055 [Ruminococcus sp.]|nr:hypothetical protein [Ruminococcus sp.]